MTGKLAEAAQTETFQMDADQALAEGLALPYALLVTYSSVTLGETPAQVDPEELLEARFFSGTREIHLFREGQILRAVSLSDTGTGSGAETDGGAMRDGGAETDSGAETAGVERFKLENSGLGDWIAVKSYLDYDEDGQAYVCARRLAGWKGGKGHG